MLTDDAYVIDAAHMLAKDELGRFGEELAAQHLRQCGMEVLDRNWRTRAGELDIVARDGGTLVVCEVKTRRTVDFGHPLAVVTPVKLRRLRHLACEWVQSHEVRPREIRIDVIGILTPRDARPILEHVRGVA